MKEGRDAGYKFSSYCRYPNIFSYVNNAPAQ